jgi:hypothetical protein
MFKTNWAILKKINIKAPFPKTNRGISNRATNILKIRKNVKHNISL